MRKVEVCGGGGGFFGSGIEGGCRCVRRVSGLHVIII
jgi:hypothetical protein